MARNRSVKEIRAEIAKLDKTIRAYSGIENVRAKNIVSNALNQMKDMQTQLEEAVKAETAAKKSEDEASRSKKAAAKAAGEAAAASGTSKVAAKTAEEGADRAKTAAGAAAREREETERVREEVIADVSQREAAENQALQEKMAKLEKEQEEWRQLYEQAVAAKDEDAPEYEAELKKVEEQLEALRAEERENAAHVERAEDDAEHAEHDAENAEDEAEDAEGGGAGSAGGKKPKKGRFKRGYDKANNAFIGAQRKVKGGFQAANRSVDNFDKKGWHSWLFAIACLFLHVYDALNDFSIAAGHRGTMLFFYALIAMWAIFFYYRTYWTKESGTYVVLSLLAFALPYLKLIPYLGTNEYLGFALAVLPVWFLYISLHETNIRSLNIAGKILLFFVTFAFLLLLLSMIVGSNVLPDVSGSMGTVGKSVKRVWTDVKDAWFTLWDRAKTGGIFSPSAWRDRINKTFNPYAQFYVGQVEDNQQEPTGVFITDLRSLFPMTYVGTDPVIIGRVEAKTFLENGIKISPSCRLERAGLGDYLGTASPEGVLDVNFRLTRDVTCTFPAKKNMTPGMYYGVMGVRFSYETWAYITNTFVSRDLLEQYYRQGRDINDDLGIDSYSEAVYTNGPVMIGVDSGDQPIDINPDATNPVQRRFGFTVANRWSQGSGAKVKKITVIVPKPFQLLDCKPTAWSGTTESEEYTNYTFSDANGIAIDPRLDYSTINCQLSLPSKNAAEEVLKFGDKVPATFVVIANYDYMLEKKTPVRIEP